MARGEDKKPRADAALREDSAVSLAFTRIGFAWRERVLMGVFPSSDERFVRGDARLFARQPLAWGGR